MVLLQFVTRRETMPNLQSGKNIFLCFEDLHTMSAVEISLAVDRAHEIAVSELKKLEDKAASAQQKCLQKAFLAKPWKIIVRGPARPFDFESCIQTAFQRICILACVGVGFCAELYVQGALTLHRRVLDCK